MAKRLPGEPPVIPGLHYVRPLGTGGFADVFLYEQDMPRRLVAVKVLLRDVVDAEMLRMFNAEADVMALLSAHPAVLTIYEASVSADGRPYLVVEYCTDSLGTRYREEVIPVPEVLDLGVRIASAVEAAHRSGLLHRDIKPSNLLISEFGAPVLSDFGIAMTLTKAAGRESFALSVPWSAPEVVDEASSGSVGSEVWSLGATIYALLAGKGPFESLEPGKNTARLLQERIRKAHYTPIGRDDVPAQLEEVLQRAMSKNPQSRHGSAAQFAHELRLVQQSMGLPMTAMEYSAVAKPQGLSAQDSAGAGQERWGPVRSTVAYESQRPERVLRPTAPEEPTKKPLLQGKMAAIVAATVIVTAVVVVGIMMLIGG